MENSAMKQRRLALNLTLEDVGLALLVLPSTVFRWENGARKPHRMFLKAWEAYLAEQEAK